MDILSRALSARPVEIIYCPECEHRKKDGYCKLVKAHVPDNEYCKDAVRSKMGARTAEMAPDASESVISAAGDKL